MHANLLKIYRNRTIPKMNDDEKILTPSGIGRIVSRENSEGELLVLFSRKDYSREEWLKRSPGNGPCIFRIFNKDECEEMK
jgi:hypothetical protein